ncbi:DegV family protein [Lacticaseibacillus baoqingensis]|uniref:DegV family protein n=1 Tax=Lacticaseibacillus baoqingensis TaxID=2486013 RepID=A0ABW4EAK5_9LACO|nr:DegV family protein [Lacticaseibacillus baoqingensis]
MFQLLTDSACDLPYQTLRDAGVDFVSMHVDVNGVEHIDDLGETFAVADLYTQIANGVMPTTAQVNVGQFVDFFTPYVKAKTPILYLGFSSGLSGTFDSATQAKAILLEDYPDADIRLVDSLAASAGLGLMVLDAIAQQKAGTSRDDLADWLEANRLRYRQWFTVDDLNYLYHGGRLSKTSAALGTMLHIKPVMDVDVAGHLRVVKKARSRQKSLFALADETIAALAAEPTHQVIIATTQAPEAAATVQERIHATYPQTPIRIEAIGAAIAAHTGLGCVAVFSLDASPRT